MKGRRTERYMCEDRGQFFDSIFRNVPKKVKDQVLQISGKCAQCIGNSKAEALR
jgi:hypothetical protein